VRDGEVSLLGGLMQTQDTSTINGIPGLVNIPVLGKYLFGGTSKDKSRGELLVAIIPHIVRRPDIEGLDLRGVAVGPDQGLKLRFAAKKEEPAAAAVTPNAPAAPSPTATTPAATPTPATTPATTTGSILSFNPAVVQAQLSGPVVVSLAAANVTDLAVIPIKIRWDPRILRLNQATAASLFSQDGSVNPSTLDIRNDSGEATIEISRLTGAPGVSGSGPLVQFTFVAIGKGSTAVTVTEANLRNSKQEPISATGPSVTVNVQ
jgi:general secretion pathway protein D